jgi:uncharacterized protein YbcV (DUF1398 family)
MNTEIMHKTLQGSESGKLTFPEVVRALVAIGVESYRADLVRGEDIFFLSSGETHVENMALPDAKIAEELSKEGLVAAIRAVQEDAIRYPEFLKRAMEAGTAAYWAFLTGRRVIYFGRKGEFHVEEFPKGK